MKTKPIRAPAEFVSALDKWSTDFSTQTGLPKNNTATMRRLAKLDGRLLVKGIDWDWVIWRKGKK